MSTDYGFDTDFAGPGQWAAEYRKAGLQVIPCYTPSEDPKNWKRPQLAEWKTLQDELVSDATFESWYGEDGKFYRRYNMGVLTGRCSDEVFVVDLDDHKNPEAAMWWRSRIEVHNNGIELETVEQRTGGGGRQKLFRANPAWTKPVPTNRTKIGVDIRGKGGFAVLPPSKHDSGQDYEWMPGCAPWETKILEAPIWLHEAVADVVDAHGSSAGADHSPSSPGAYEYDGFGGIKDGREDRMFRHVWHELLEWKRECPILPPEQEWQTRAWEAYQRYENLVTLQHPTAGRTKREQLEEENRGWTLYWEKFRRDMRKHWGTPEFWEEALKPPPDPEPAGPRASDPPPPGVDEFGTKLVGIPLISAFPIDEASLPVRDWIVPGLLLRRNLSVLIAPPAAGKSLLTLQLSIAIAVGMPWAGWRPRRAEKVLIINAEDDVDEMRRRLVAAAREMGVEQEALVGRILLVEVPESIVIARTDSRTKTVIRMPLIEELVATIEREGVGVTIADPFAETFEGDENSNSEVKWAGILWREVARRTRTSLLLVHHTRKYAGDMAGVADASRGGGALIGTARVMCSLYTMTDDEAKAMGVEEDDRGDYARFDDAKANYSKLERARWFKKKTVTLNNATGFIPGDEVGVFEPWKPAGGLDGVSTADLNKALDEIDRGVLDERGQPTGQFYTRFATSEHKERWAGSILVAVTGMSEGNAKGLIKKWVENEVLEVFEYTDPVQRRSRKGIRSVLHNRPGRTETYE